MVIVIEVKEVMIGEDFGYMLKKYFGFMFWFGVDFEYGFYYVKLNFDENVIEIVVNVMIGYFFVYVN